MAGHPGAAGRRCASRLLIRLSTIHRTSDPTSTASLMNSWPLTSPARVMGSTTQRAPPSSAGVTRAQSRMMVVRMSAGRCSAIDQNPARSCDGRILCQTRSLEAIPDCASPHRSPRAPAFCRRSVSCARRPVRTRCPRRRRETNAERGIAGPPLEVIPHRGRGGELVKERDAQLPFDDRRSASGSRHRRSSRRTCRPTGVERDQLVGELRDVRPLRHGDARPRHLRGPGRVRPGARAR